MSNTKIGFSNEVKSSSEGKRDEVQIDLKKGEVSSVGHGSEKMTPQELSQFIESQKGKGDREAQQKAQEARAQISSADKPTVSAPVQEMSKDAYLQFEKQMKKKKGEGTEQTVTADQGSVSTQQTKPKESFWNRFFGKNKE